MTKGTIKLFLLAFMCAFFTDACFAESPSYTYSVKINKINLNQDLSTADRVKQLEQAYKVNMSPDRHNLETLDNDDLHAMFKAASMLATYTLYSSYADNSYYLRDMQTDLEALQSRNQALDSYYVDIYGAYVAVRKFDVARRVKALRPSIDVLPIPDVEVDHSFRPNLPSQLVPTSDTNIVRLESISLSIPNRIVVVASCHIAEGAARHIKASKLLSSAFSRGNAVWLSPAARYLDLQEIQNWNKEFPEQKMTVAYENSAWPNIDFSNSPTFYFFRYGRLIGTYIGWPRDDKATPKPILEALKEMKLL